MAEYQAADDLKLVRDFLLTQSAYTTAVTGGTYANRRTPPQGHTAADGTIALLSRRGGFGEPDESEAVRYPAYQFLIYGGGASYQVQANAADAAGRILYNVLHGASSEMILSANQETEPVPLEDEAGWPYVLVFYDIMVRNVEA